jgi:cbb3-type cytochrome oxidase subunit 3
MLGCDWLDNIFNLGIALIALEILFWIAVVVWVYKRKKPKKSIWHEEP